MLCNEESFQKFLTEKVVPCDSADGAAKIVRGLCNVTSRAEMATNTAAATKWRDVVAGYRAWQREPEIVETIKPATLSDDSADDLMAWDSKLATAAHMGVDALREEWGNVPREFKPMLKAAMDNRHKPTAENAPA